MHVNKVNSPDYINASNEDFVRGNVLLLVHVTHLLIYLSLYFMRFYCSYRRYFILRLLKASFRRFTGLILTSCVSSAGIPRPNLSFILMIDLIMVRSFLSHSWINNRVKFIKHYPINSISVNTIGMLSVFQVVMSSGKVNSVYRSAPFLSSSIITQSPVKTCARPSIVHTRNMHLSLKLLPRKFNITCYPV